MSKKIVSIFLLMSLVVSNLLYTNINIVVINNPIIITFFFIFNPQFINFIY